MNDEQTIYISPDDDLTTVRSRLEQIPSRRITLVIPSQTQLRSHVAWKLLYARTRELGKEVLIVSSDPQVRSVAHAVKFKVAYSLETSSNSANARSRSGSRAGGARSGSGRTNADGRNRTGNTTRSASGKGGGPSEYSPIPPQPTRNPSTPQHSTWSELEDLPVSPSNRPADGEEGSRFSRFKPGTPPIRKEPDQSYEFRIEAAPSIHPLPMNDQVEDLDLLSEDYSLTQDIWQAASGSLPPIEPSEADDGAAANTTRPSQIQTPVDISKLSRSASQIYGDDDPFFYMQDDSQPPSQPEQRGSATFEDNDISQGHLSAPANLAPPARSASGPGISSSTIFDEQIEYRGDNDEQDLVPPLSPTPITQIRKNHPLEEKPEQDEQPPHQASRTYGGRSRNNQGGTRPPLLDEEDRLPAIPEHPARLTSKSLPIREQSQPQVRSSQPLPSWASAQGPTMPPAPTSPSRRPVNEPASRAGSRTLQQPDGNRMALSPVTQRGAAGRPGNPFEPSSIKRPTNKRRRGRGVVLTLVLLLLLAVLAVVGYGYLNISSTVYVAVTTQSYTHNVTLTLSNSNQPETVPATLVTHEFTKSAQEPVTGQKMQATNVAKGFVYFTNTGNTPIQVPSQTVIMTPDGIQFVTTVTVLIDPQSANTTPLKVTIQARNPGIAGNVPAGDITVLPQRSLDSIAQAQFTNTTITADTLQTILSVTNPFDTTGGGANQVPAIAQQDLDNARQDLQQKAQNDINAWVLQTAKNGLAGQPVITATLLNPPAIDQVEQNTTFLATLQIKATVLVAQLANLQNAAATQLRTAIHNDAQLGVNFVLVGDATSITIDQVLQHGSHNNTVVVNASGKIGPALDINIVQQTIAGKSFADAHRLLLHLNNKIQNVTIETQPGFYSSVSPWANHINIVLQTAQATPTPKK